MLFVRLLSVTVGDWIPRLNGPSSYLFRGRGGVHVGPVYLDGLWAAVLLKL